MKILVVADLPDSAVEALRSLGSQVDVDPQLSGDKLRQALSDAGVAIISTTTRISGETIQSAPSLQMIVVAGHGLGEVTLEEASAQGVFVCHCPDQHGVAVAEHAFGLMLALDRRIVENTLALREGRWTPGELADGRGLAGRTLGILGFGAVGRLLAERAQAFGMQVLAWSPGQMPDGAQPPDVEFCNWPRELARRSDVVCVCTPSEGDNSLLVDAEFLENMPVGACLVHVGSTGAVDENALLRAISQRRLRVALDAHTSEPTAGAARFRSRLFELPGVIGTQHVSELTAQARQAVADEVVRIVRAFLVAGEVLRCQNLCERSPATWQLVLRVRDQIGVMASILDAIRADGINAEEVTSRVFVGAKAAWCTVALDERPSTEALAAIRALPDVLHLELRAVV